jgi:ComF family protein
MSRLAGPVVDVLLPPVCWAGGGPVTGDGAGGATGGLADGVRERIARLAAEPYCCHCGLTVGPYEVHDARDPCGRCGSREVGVVRIARVGTFSEPLVTLIHRLKFGRSWEVAGVLAPLLYGAVLGVSEAAYVPVDALVPVPLHWWRRVRRGFNQAHELSRGVAALSGWAVVDALRRPRATGEQARTASATRRRENLRGAFTPARAARRGAVAGKHVWLVDDVSTTGATLHAAAVALRRLPRELRPASINAAVVCVTDDRGR